MGEKEKKRKEFVFFFKKREKLWLVKGYHASACQSIVDVADRLSSSSSVSSLPGNVQDKAFVHFHLLIVFFALELKAVDIFSGPCHLRTIERSRIGISCQHLFPWRKQWQDRANLWNWDQGDCCRLVNSTLFTILVRFGILDIIPFLHSQTRRISEDKDKRKHNIPFFMPLTGNPLNNALNPFAFDTLLVFVMFEDDFRSNH